jgi:hypothetical protein
MPMGPAEIVASLKELCEAKGPRLTTSQIVGWIDRNGGYESDAELIAFAKKMKARQFARMLTFEDEESGRRIKRLWSFRDSSTGRRAYADICDMSPESRKQLIQKYAYFQDQLRSVRRAMSDYFAGQQFFNFYVGELETESADLFDKN